MRTWVVAAATAALVALLAPGCGAPGEQSALPPATEAATTSSEPPTTTTAPLGPDAEFRAAGRTLLVRPSERRRPYGQLGAELPVPSDIQVEMRAPGAEDVAAFAVPRDAWESDARGEPLDVAPAGQPGRWVWTASIAPGQYVVEATFTISGASLVVRAPVRVG